MNGLCLSPLSWSLRSKSCLSGALAACAVAHAAAVGPVRAQTSTQPAAQPTQAVPLVQESPANTYDYSTPTPSAAITPEPRAVVQDPYVPPATVTSTTVVAVPAEPVYPVVRSRTQNEAGFLIGVPIWFTPDNGVVQPGVSFEGRFARRYGMIAPELTLGWQINWLDEDELPRDLRDYNLTIDAFYISAGARAYLMESGKVIPFISAAFDLAFWHMTGDTQTACGYYYCATTANYDVGIGFSGRVGFAFLPSDHFQLEVGARIAMTFPVGPIEDVESWVTPYLGFTSRF